MQIPKGTPIKKCANCSAKFIQHESHMVYCDMCRMELAMNGKLPVKPKYLDDNEHLKDSLAENFQELEQYIYELDMRSDLGIDHVAQLSEVIKWRVAQLQAAFHHVCTTMSMSPSMQINAYQISQDMLSIGQFKVLGHVSKNDPPILWNDELIIKGD